MVEKNEFISSSTLPFDEVAEQSVLGAMLLDETATEIALERLQVTDFYQNEYRIVFESIQNLVSQSKPVEIVSLRNDLIKKNRFDELGGMAFLLNISNSVGSALHILEHIKLVEEKSTIRQLITVTESIAQLGYENTESANDLLAKAEQHITNITKSQHSEDFHAIGDILLTSLSRIEEIYESQGKLTGLPTGFTDFDFKTAGLQKSDLILLAARPSMGKTAFALNIAHHVALKQNCSVAIFSLEMSKDQLMNRLLCSEASIDAQKLRSGDLQTPDWESIIQAIHVLSSAKVYIDDTPGISPREILSKCRKLKIERGIDLIVIDYIQLMSGGGGKQESRQQEISSISRHLKGIAREIDVPIIALSQLSRACEQRADHRPLLSDLRESGAIEQDADVVAFLYRDEYYFPETEKQNMAELIIAKQRNGPTGTVELAWLGQYTKFGNYAR